MKTDTVPAQETERILNFLVSRPRFANTVVTRGMAQELLAKTDGKIMAHGQLWELIVKSVGAGMHRVSLKEMP